VDDARIRQLTAEVMKDLRSAPESSAAPDLEARVAALEATVARLLGGSTSTSSAATAPEAHVHTHAHPALRVLNVPGGGERCVLEPDRPCTQSGTCRTFGH
jgi:hypothetical protein